jgi:hypothetical protein
VSRSESGYAYGVEREVPEGDALEQERDAFPGGEDDETELDRVTDDPEAPEADAFEQAQPAPVEDDDLYE